MPMTTPGLGLTILKVVRKGIPGVQGGRLHIAGGLFALDHTRAVRSYLRRRDVLPPGRDKQLCVDHAGDRSLRAAKAVFVLQGDGTFDGTTASGRSTVVSGSVAASSPV